MATVPQNLVDIMNARYGRDVRQAIHDSIEACYTESKIVPRGAYSSTTTYSFPDVVTYGGGSYLYIYPSSSINKVPTNATYWMPVATKGDTGQQGIQGPQGLKGDTGDTGPQGLKGDKGDTGDTGPQGLKGDKGDTGDTGDTGSQGIQGPQGLKGDKGDTGDTGPQGTQGIKGDKGDTGDTGLQGLQGDPGPKGDKGDTGAQGSQGPMGTTAYSSAVAGGYTGTEAEFHADLAALDGLAAALAAL